MRRYAFEAAVAAAVLSAGRATAGNSAPNLTGFGATQSAWNSAHIEDPHFATDAANDRTLGLRGGAQDRYYGLSTLVSHVNSYGMAFVDGTSIGSARSAVLHGVPADSTIQWSRVKTTCAREQIYSATLAKALGGRNDSDPAGTVYFEFGTNKPDGTEEYDSTDIKDVQELPGLDASEAPGFGC